MSYGGKLGGLLVAREKLNSGSMESKRLLAAIGCNAVSFAVWCYEVVRMGGKIVCGGIVGKVGCLRRLDVMNRKRENWFLLNIMMRTFTLFF
jgi:hypothetical protein